MLPLALLPTPSGADALVAFGEAASSMCSPDWRSSHVADVGAFVADEMLVGQSLLHVNARTI
jgi:hypothetical protein